jgi:hypothetical protein
VLALHKMQCWGCAACTSRAQVFKTARVRFDKERAITEDAKRMKAQKFSHLSESI